MRRESEKRAASKYKKSLRRFWFALNPRKDPDLIAFLEGQSNIQSYLRELVRADMDLIRTRKKSRSAYNVGKADSQ